MLGAIAGDIIGSVYEKNESWMQRRRVDFEPLFSLHARYTDDTVLTCAIADQILHGGDLVDVLKAYARAYPTAGYGRAFKAWFASEDRNPYYSSGNGSAMRVSPVGFAYDMLDEVIVRARWTAEVTHNHPEGLKGAQATAAAVFLARTGSSKQDIRQFIEHKFQYDLAPSVEDIRPSYEFDASCQGSVPQAMIAFLDATDYESAVRLAISLGGDADTLGCIAGAIAGAYYGVPKGIRDQAVGRLDDHLRAIVEEFESRFPPAERHF
jgi:ADP-ribosylglycohydrolase